MAEMLDHRLEIRNKLVSLGMGVPESTVEPVELPRDPLELSSASAVQLISPCPRLALYCHLLKAGSRPQPCLPGMARAWCALPTVLPVASLELAPASATRRSFPERPPEEQRVW